MAGGRLFHLALWPVCRRLLFQRPIDGKRVRGSVPDPGTDGPVYRLRLCARRTARSLTGRWRGLVRPDDPRLLPIRMDLKRFDLDFVAEGRVVK